MPQMEKSKLMAFAKKAATPPPAAIVLAQKRAAAKAPAAPVGAPAAPKAPMQAGGGEEEPVNLFELVEEAAEAAEAGQDVELEDVIAGSKSKGPEDPPEWVEDASKWAEAAEAVGLGIPGTEDKYEEPVVVTAYLYKMIHGAVKGLEIPAPPVAPEEEGPADMSKPGAAAKALKARSAPQPAEKQAPAPTPKPSAKQVTQSTPGDSAQLEGGDELKQLTDEAAKAATETPDATVVQKLQEEPPQEGQAPSWAAEGEKWAQAETAVKANWGAYPDPWLVVAHVYLKMGGRVQ